MYKTQTNYSRINNFSLISLEIFLLTTMVFAFSASSYSQVRIDTNHFKSTDIHASHYVIEADTLVDGFLNSYLDNKVNYYIGELEKDSSNFIIYYELAKTFYINASFYLWRIEKVIYYSNKCLSINPYYENAYLLKARALEESAIIKGIIGSDPHVEVVDINEIRGSIDCLNKCLRTNPNNIEAREYLKELKNKYGKKYKL